MWDPMQELVEMRSRLGRALHGADPRWLRAAPRARRSASPLPPLDVCETPEAYIVRVDVPGLSRTDLHLAVESGALEIAGEVPERVGGGEDVLRAERFRGAFRRVVPLPREADAAAVKASLADGVLTVTVPRRLPGGRRSVEIE
jgi:HSP20 family protein